MHTPRPKRKMACRTHLFVVGVCVCVSVFIRGATPPRKRRRKEKKKQAKSPNFGSALQAACRTKPASGVARFPPHKSPGRPQRFRDLQSVTRFHLRKKIARKGEKNILGVQNKSCASVARPRRRRADLFLQALTLSHLGGDPGARNSGSPQRCGLGLRGGHQPSVLPS